MLGSDQIDGRDELFRRQCGVNARIRFVELEITRCARQVVNEVCFASENVLQDDSLVRLVRNEYPTTAPSDDVRCFYINRAIAGGRNAGDIVSRTERVANYRRKTRVTDYSRTTAAAIII